jgi:hypothetical protein
MLRVKEQKGRAPNEEGKNKIIFFCSDSFKNASAANPQFGRENPNEETELYFLTQLCYTYQAHHRSKIGMA